MALTEEGLIEIPNFLSRWVRLPNGTKAHYMTAGESGPAVVLVHGGITGSSGLAGWRFMAPFLGANGFRVYCPDLPGFGLTEDPTEFYRPGWIGHVDFLHDFTSALCLDRFHIGGNSNGTRVSTNYMCAHHERVISAALVAGPIGLGDLGPAWEDLYYNEPKSIISQGKMVPFDGTEDSMRALMGMIIHRGEAISDDLVTMRTTQANRTRDAYARRQENDRNDLRDPDVAARLRVRDRLDRLSTPTIYLYGQNDVLLPVETGYVQEDNLPNWQFFYPEETGHQGQTDRPEIFNRVFLEFFRDGKVSWEAARAAGVSHRRAPNASLVDVPPT